jgi:hypothetical protein
VLVVVMVVMAADTASAKPFGQIWEKRRAELYARLSRDVSVRVQSRVSAAKTELQDSLVASYAGSSGCRQRRLGNRA